METEDDEDEKVRGRKNSRWRTVAQREASGLKRDQRKQASEPGIGTFFFCSNEVKHQVLGPSPLE